MSAFDIAVIGAGPGGYVAAIRAAQLGLRVAVVEADKLGGVCLNWGCIPSKALLTGAELVENLTRHGETFGISAAGLTLDYGKLIDHSRKTADRLVRGVESLFKKNKIRWIRGRGRLAGPRAVDVEGPDAQRVEARHVLLATGSSEWVPPGLAVDGERVLTSREALASRRRPDRPRSSACPRSRGPSFRAGSRSRPLNGAARRWCTSGWSCGPGAPRTAIAPASPRSRRSS